MILESLPHNLGKNHDKVEKIILKAIQDKKCEYNFVPLKVYSEDKKTEIELYVFDDALKIEGVRINVSAKIQQKVADLLNCILPTAKIYDLMWHNCEEKINPMPRLISMTKDAMVEHSQKIDKALENNNSIIKSTVGKTWIVDNAIKNKNGRACNYGWHFTTGNKYKGIRGNVCASLLKNPETNSYWYMIQSRGFHHQDTHLDYSQNAILISKQCFVNGQERNITEVLQDPELAGIINHDGVLRVLRQPDVEELNPIEDFPVKRVEIKEQPSLPSSIDIIFSSPINSAPTLTSIPFEEEEPKQEIVKVEDNGGFLALIMNILKIILSLFSKKS